MDVSKAAGDACRGETLTISRDGEVPATVDTSADTLSRSPAAVTLHNGLEEGDIRGLQDNVGRVLEGSPLATYVAVEVALEATWIVLQGIPTSYRAQVDGKVGEGRTLLQTATSRTGLCTTDRRSVVLDVLAVASQAVLAAVPER